MASTQTNPQVKLTKQTWVPLGAAAMLIVVIAGGSWNVSSRLANVDHTLADLSKGLAGLNERMDKDMEEHWSRSDMISFAELLKAQNPEMTVPTVRSRR